MLVLHRKHGESVLLDTSDGVVMVTLLKDRRGGWKLAVEAPEAVGIWRPENCPPELLAKVKVAEAGR